MRILLALGGNASVPGGEPARRRDIEAAVTALADLAGEHEVVVTHDCGLQVGQMLELALRNALPERDVVSVLTQVVVVADAPDLRNGDGRRRFAPSSEPYAIAEIRSLRVLLDSGALVVCAGAAGVPVALNGTGTLHRVETAIDKDLTAALLARRLDADLLLMPTDLDTGLIEPKLEAARRFVDATGRRAAIGSLRDVAQMVGGEAGTQVWVGAEPAIGAPRRPPLH
jgi:carbamate kinase